jgi:hypothetical protein
MGNSHGNTFVHHQETLFPYPLHRQATSEIKEVAWSHYMFLRDNSAGTHDSVPSPPALHPCYPESLDAAEQAISQSRSRLESAYSRLAELHKNVIGNLNADNSVIDTGPKKVASQRTKPAIAAPAKKAVAKKKPAKRR